MDEIGRSSQTFLSLSFDAVFGANGFKGIHYSLLYIDKRTNKESKYQCTLSAEDIWLDIMIPETHSQHRLSLVQD